jgi:hypothetical protein
MWGAAGRDMDAVALLEVLAIGSHAAYALAHIGADPKPGAGPGLRRRGTPRQRSPPVPARILICADVSLVGARRLAHLQDLAEEARREPASRIGTLHDLQWVLFDDDTRLLFASNFDGDWDAYIDDFGALIPEAFDAVLQHTEDYPGIEDPSIKDFVVAHQATACTYFRGAPDVMFTEIQKALRVNKAFQHLLDEAS